MTFCALMSRWSSPALCTAATARQTSIPTSNVSRHPNDASRAARIWIERQPLDQFHPQADGSVVLVDAVDHHHAWMPHAGEQAPFLDDRVPIGRAARSTFKATWRSEKRIPRQIHRAETATADLRRISSRPHAFGTGELGPTGVAQGSRLPLSPDEPQPHRRQLAALARSPLVRTSGC